MSVISNVHTLYPFVSGESKPLTGQRLAKIGFKTTKAMEAKGLKALPSVCASVPFLTQEEIMGSVTALLPFIGTMLEGVQDQIIRGLYEGKKGALENVRDEDISVSQCIAFLESEATGSRLSSESIKAWFNGSVASVFSQVIIMDALKYGTEPAALTEEQSQTVQKHVGIYAEVMAMLAGKGLTRSSFSDKQWARLAQILDLTLEESPEDTFAQKLKDKMSVISKAVKIEDII